MTLPARRASDNVRQIGTASFKDTEPVPPKVPEQRVPEWVARAKANALPAKVLRWT